MEQDVETLVRRPSQPIRLNNLESSERPDSFSGQYRAGAKIEVAQTKSQYDAAAALVNKMYTWRGYGSHHELVPSPNRITLIASERDIMVGTLSVSVESGGPEFIADQLFKEELDNRRADGARLCELTKLAIDPAARSKFTLAKLFHFALIYVRDMHGCTDAVMEVNPRHRAFYERSMGFSQLGETRINPSVNAPACLMHIRIAHISMQVQQHGGAAARGSSTIGGCFYQFFSSAEEEIGMPTELTSACVPNLHVQPSRRLSASN